MSKIVEEAKGERSGPLTVMIDSMIYDRLAADSGMHDRCKELELAGRLALLTTHIQADQIAEIGDVLKRVRLQRLEPREVNTSGMAWDISRWGKSEWTSDIDVEVIKLITSGTKPGSAKYMKDALIALTAVRKADALVTEDKRLLNQLPRVFAPNALKVWNFAEFAAWVNAQI